MLHLLNCTSSIQTQPPWGTLLLVPEFHRVSGHPKMPGRGLYRQWGIAPRPEDNDSLVFY